jgi:response regulator RpfG family c-di-GMP phosphodiesterase
VIQTTGKSDAPRILVVDDEPAVLESLADLFRKEFRVTATDDPDEAIRFLETNTVSLLLTDQRMPRITGAKLIERCAHVSPQTTRILITGYADLEAVVEAVNEGKVYHYVSKPWESAQLLELVRSAVNRSRLEQEELTLIEQLSTVAAVSVSPAPAPAPPPAASRLSPSIQNEILRRTVRTFGEAVSVLEQLKAVVPVCMYCQKVKTAEGEWHAMLNYLRQNSLVLSHGVCPECERPLAGRGDGKVGRSGHE